MLGASVRALSVATTVSPRVPCGGLCVGESRDFHCGVKIPPVFRDSSLFSRWDASPLRKNRQMVRREGSSVATNALRTTADSGQQEVRVSFLIFPWSLLRMAVLGLRSLTDGSANVSRMQVCETGCLLRFCSLILFQLL